MSYDPDKFPTGEQEPIMTVMFENITADEVKTLLYKDQYIKGGLIIGVDGSSVLCINRNTIMRKDGASIKLVNNNEHGGGKFYTVMVDFDGEDLFIESVNDPKNSCPIIIRRKAEEVLAQALGL